MTNLIMTSYLLRGAGKSKDHMFDLHAQVGNLYTNAKFTFHQGDGTTEFSFQRQPRSGDVI